MRVQPFDGLRVFLTSTLHNPYDASGFFSGCVRNDLAKMLVVGLFKLILDDDRLSVFQLFSKNICPEISDPLFRTDSLQIHPHSLPEKIEVLFLGEPFREIGGFVLPNGSEIVDFFEFSEEA